MFRMLLIPFAILALFSVGAYALLATAPELEPATPEPVPLSVRVITVEPRSVQLSVRSQGSVAPAVEAQLIPEVTGRIEWIAPSLVAGGRFSEGEPLLRIVADDYRNTAARSRASLKRNEAEFENARFEYERQQELVKKQLISQSQLESARRAFRVAEAAVAEARISAKQAELDLARTTLRAPFSGLVRSETVDIGQFVSRGAAVATIYAEQQTEVRLPIADRQLAYLNLPFGVQGSLPEAYQAPVTLAAEYGGDTLRWQGRIVRTEAAIDLSSRMVYLVARVSTQKDFPPPAVGLFVDATIEGRSVDDIYVLPRSALRNNNQLLIVDEEDRLRFRPIEALRVQDEELLVSRGLSAGDRVCISEIQTVVEGMNVLPLAEPEVGAAIAADGV